MKNYKKKEIEQRKERLYRVATKTLYDKGYEKTTIRELAKAAGITTAGLYYYFKSKEELLFQILNQHMDDLLEGIDLRPLDIDAGERLKQTIHFQVKTLCEDRYRSKLMLTDDTCLSGKWARTITEKQNRYLDFWQAILKSYCTEKQITCGNLPVYAHFLIGMCNWIYRWYNPQNNIKPEILADRICRVFLSGFGNSAGQNPSLFSE